MFWSEAIPVVTSGQGSSSVFSALKGVDHPRDVLRLINMNMIRLYGFVVVVIESEQTYMSQPFLAVTRKSNEAELKIADFYVESLVSNTKSMT